MDTLIKITNEMFFWAKAFTIWVCVLVLSLIVVGWLDLTSVAIVAMLLLSSIIVWLAWVIFYVLQVVKILNITNISLYNIKQEIANIKQEINKHHKGIK